MSLHVNKNACLKHNHTAEYVNIIKLNFAVKITVDNEMIKEYASIQVNRLLQNVKFSINKLVLQQSDEQHLNLKKVHNAD